MDKKAPIHSGNSNSKVLITDKKLAYTKFYNKENNDEDICQCVQWHKTDPGRTLAR